MRPLPPPERSQNRVLASRAWSLGRGTPRRGEGEAGASTAAHHRPLCFPDHHSEGESHVGDGGAGQDHHSRPILAEPDPAGAAGRGAGRLPHQAGGEGAAGERGSTLTPPHLCRCPRLGMAQQFCPHVCGQGEAVGPERSGGVEECQVPLGTS